MSAVSEKDINIKINYQLMTNEILKELDALPQKKRLLLHACCAPCSSYVLEYLTEHFDITVFFSNSNITDAVEYQKRLHEIYRLLSLMPGGERVSVIEDEYTPLEYLGIVKGYEKEKEGAKRCEKCFVMRVNKTAQKARELNFDYFATTLTVSPHKNSQLINKIGFDAERLIDKAALYLPSDFKKREGYKRSIELSHIYGLYRQDFCGCEFSRNF